MSIKKLFKQITSGGEISIVQKGFLYEARVDTRERELVFKDFVTLVRYFLKNQYLEICLKIQGKKNVDNILAELKKTGVSVHILQNELFWIIELDEYEVDILLSTNLPEDKIQTLIEGFYEVVDAVLLYPVGYMSWSDHFNQKQLVS